MIKVTQEKNVTHITLNRPELHNAFDDRVIQELINAFQQAETNAACKVVLLDATGKSFSAGADIHWMQRMAHYSYEENMADAKKLAELMSIIYRLKKNYHCRSSRSCLWWRCWASGLL